VEAAEIWASSKDLQHVGFDDPASLNISVDPRFAAGCNRVGLNSALYDRS
jgi:hypothetical protein